MEDVIRIGVAQLQAVRGEIETNTRTHLDLIAVAASHDVDVLLFPELSMTGYELDLAAELAMAADSPLLKPFKKQAAEHGMTILVGAPVANEGDKPRIGLFIIRPDGDIGTYCKMHLHGPEKDFCSEGSEPFILHHGEFQLGLAICADTSVPAHASQAAQAGADAYLASVLFSTGGYRPDTEILAGYAKEHGMTVCLSNYAGPSGGYICAGGAAVWNDDGDLLAQADDSPAALVIATISKNDAKAKWERITSR